MAIKTIEQFRTEATSEIEGKKPIYKQVNNVRSELDESEYAQAIEDLAQSKLDKQDNQYKRDRLESYLAWREQLDQLFWDIDAGKLDKTGEWYKAVKKVKDTYPKP
jgi:phosphoribosylformylglycinamidine (FGAM) synthase-like enzyme